MFKTISTIAVFLVLLAVPTAQAEEYTIDSQHSFVRFDISYGGFGRAYGNFARMTGSVTFDKNNLEAANLDITVHAETIWTGVEKRDDHLRSPDFFNVKQYPVITFKSKRFEQEGDHYSVTGDLTLLGTTKEVTIDFRVIGIVDKAIGGEAAFSVKRSEYGMNFMQDQLGDEVNLEVAIIGRQ